MRALLYDRGLVSRLKKGVKRRAVESGRKSAGGRWWGRKSTGSSSLWWWLFVAVNVARAGVFSQKNGTALDATLYCSASLIFAGVVLGSATKLRQRLWLGEERAILQFYPLEDREFYWWSTWRFAARLLWVPLVAAVLPFLVMDMNSWSMWLGVGAGALAEWLIVLCAVLALEEYTNSYPRWAPLAVYTAGALVVFLPQQFLGTMQPLAWALPTGWLGWAATNHRVRGEWGWVAAGALITAALLLAWLWKRSEARYCAELTGEPAEKPSIQDSVSLEALQAYTETVVEDAPEEAGSEATLPMNVAWQKQRLENWAPRVAEVVWQGDWLKGWNWNALPPIERADGWVLNAREKIEAQFLLGPRLPGWSARWRVAVVATAVAFAASLPGVKELNIVAAVAFAVSIAAGLPILGGAWPATDQGRISGKFSPIFACFPVGYWRLSRVMWKLNMVRIVAWIPLGIMLGLLGAKSSGMALWQGCLVVGKSLLLLASFMPIMIAGKFSKGTNDTTNVKWRAVATIAVAVTVMVVVISLGLGAVFAEGWWSAGFLMGVALMSGAAWWMYGMYYERAKVDLLREQR